VVILLSNSCTPEYRPDFLRRGADQAFHTATEFEQAVEALTALARERRSEASQ
jgi:DNA-binding NarL/FixJ family response regulator